MFKTLNSIFLFISFLLFADPWGKDADLATFKANPCTNNPSNNQESPLVNLGIRAIKFHQEIISPADGPRSHYIPSSSQYTLEAMRKHGFFQGYIMGCDRLMRENDEEWVYRKISDSRGCVMKSDPIP